MHEIDLTTIVRRECSEVYALLRNNIEKLSKVARGVRRLRVVETLGPNARLTEWVVDIGGVLVSWCQKEQLDDQTMSLSFSQTQGDYRQLKGRWELSPVKEGTQLRLKVQLDLGVSRWELAAGKIFKRKATVNYWLLLKDIRRILENSHHG